MRASRPATCAWSSRDRTSLCLLAFSGFARRPSDCWETFAAAILIHGRKILSLPVFFTTRQRAGLREGYLGRHQTARPVLHLHDSLEAHLRSVRRLAGAPNMRLKWPILGAKLPVITAPMKVGFPNDRARELTFGKPLKAEVWLG